MKFLLDENLSPKLVERLSSLFGAIQHVREVGLERAPDLAIWEYARDNECSIVTTDSDFVAIAQSRGFPPKVIHLARCDFPLRVIELCLRGHAIRIAEFVQRGDTGVLSLAMQPRPSRPH